MAIGLLVLRIVAGALFAGHGAQKLFGFFGGHGLNATGSVFESLGLRPARIMALAVGLAELAGGALFALGLLTPLAAALMIVVMVTAIATVHWHSGVWVTDGGFEYNLVLATVAFSVTLRRRRQVIVRPRRRLARRGREVGPCRAAWRPARRTRRDRRAVPAQSPLDGRHAGAGMTTCSTAGRGGASPAVW
jgi:putative oxidoreductase